jgi:hypothetical protein
LTWATAATGFAEMFNFFQKNKTSGTAPLVLQSNEMHFALVL